MPTPTALPSAFQAGDVLTSANMNLLRGGFRILQLSVAVLNTQQTSTSATFADITGGSVTITPQAASNKILIIHANAFFADAAACSGSVRFLRDATNAFTARAAIMAINTGGNFTSIHLDSPNSTSAIVYKVQFARSFGGGTLFSQIGGSTDTIGAFVVAEVSA